MCVVFHVTILQDGQDVFIERLPCQCELEAGPGSIIIMFLSQIEDSYKNPRHRRYPSERFQEEEPAQTGKFEVILGFIIRTESCIKRFLKGRFRTRTFYIIYGWQGHMLLKYWEIKIYYCHFLTQPKYFQFLNCWSVLYNIYLYFSALLIPLG